MKPILLSVSKLAQKLQLSTQQLYQQLNKQGLIQKDSVDWVLTNAGINAGGEAKNFSKNGQIVHYVVFPENIKLAIKPIIKTTSELAYTTNIEPQDAAENQPKNQPSGQSINQPKINNKTNKSSLLTVTKLGEKFGLSGVKINRILSELGWIGKGLKGWNITKQGKKQQGEQFEDFRSGVPYVKWQADILQSAIFLDSIAQTKGQDSPSKQVTVELVEFRDKFPAKHRSTDGHFVRSKAEMLIDNWLYMAEIVHAYERQLPVEEIIYCDFYIPAGKVYIEYWGYDNDPKYLARKKAKQAIYQKYGFNLIELEDKAVQNLDDILPKLLLKHGVQAY